MGQGQKKRNGEVVTFLESKIGRFQEAGRAEKETIAEHIEDEIEAWTQLVEVVEKSASPHGSSSVQVSLRQDVRAYKADLEAIATEMRLHIEQSGRKCDKLQGLRKKVVDKAHEAKSQRWLLSTNLVVGQQNASAITGVSAKCLALEKTLEGILQKQTKIEERLRKIQTITIPTQLGEIKKQIEEMLEALLQKLDHVLTQTPSGEAAAVTPPQTPSLSLRIDDVAATGVQSPSALYPHAIRNSRASPPPITTPTRRQRPSRDIAPQSRASSSKSSTGPPALRSERTDDMQYTADTSQEDIYSAGEESRKYNGEDEEPLNPVDSPNYPRNARWGRSTLAHSRKTEEQQRLVDKTWSRALPANDNSIMFGLYCGNLEPSGMAVLNLKDIKATSNEMAFAVAIPDHRLRHLIAAHKHAIENALPVESCRRIVTIVFRFHSWPIPFRSTLNNMRAISQAGSGGSGTVAARARQVAVLRWDDVFGQSAGQVYAQFRVIRAIHKKMQEEACARLPFEGMVVCVPIQLDEYIKWAHGDTSSEALEVLWEQGILATVSEKSELGPWCPKTVSFSDRDARVELITHEYTHPDLPPEEEDRSNRVPVHFVVLLYAAGYIKEATDAVQYMGLERPAAGAGAADAGGAGQFDTLPYCLRGVAEETAWDELMRHYPSTDTPLWDTTAGGSNTVEVNTAELSSRPQLPVFAEFTGENLIDMS